MPEQLDDRVGAFRDVPRWCEAAKFDESVSCSDEPGQARYDVVTITSSGREMLRTAACSVHGREEVRRAQMAGQMATTELRGPFVLRLPDLLSVERQAPTHARVVAYDPKAGTVEVEVRVDVERIDRGLVHVSSGGTGRAVAPGDQMVIRASLDLPGPTT